MFDPNTIGEWLGVLILAGVIFSGTIKFLFWVYDEWQKRKKHGGFTAPTKTFRLATMTEGSCWWHMGKKDNEPIMQVVGRMFITNIASVPARITQVELQYGFWGRKRISGIVMVSRQLHENMYGMYDIPPNETRNVSFDFWVYPPVANSTETFIAHAIIFIDQFGNRHTVKRIQFPSDKSKTPPPPKEPEEFPYSISDPIEKQIVSVLKAELSRYEMCGRRVGGLGSVYIVYQGKSLTGLGSDSWTSNSPLNQLIVSDPEAASLESDNLKALIDFYKGIKLDNERERFVKALMNRLDVGRGYLAISYFIVCVLWKVDSLDQALQKARRDLPAGENRLFGLSNVFLLLNGLLKYRHLDFTSQMLDMIEQMTHGINEHTFMISGKIAAIRAARLS